METVLRLLLREATSYVKTQLAVVLFLIVSASALSALGPVALKWMIDDLIDERAGGRGPALVWVALYVLSIWLARTANEVRELVFGRARQRIFCTLSERVFSHLMRLPMRFHLERRTGAVAQTLDNGVEGLRVILHHLVFTCVPVGVELTTVFLVLGKLVTPLLFILFCAAVTCYLTAFAYSAATIAAAARRASTARVNAAAAMTDSLLNYEAVKYFTAESVVQERVATELKRCEHEWVGFYRRYAINGLVVAGIFAAFLAGTVILGIGDVESGRMTIGDFVLVNTYLLQVVRPVEMVGYAMQGLSHGIAMLEKVELLLREPTESECGEGWVKGAAQGSVEFKDVSLSYSTGRAVLKAVSFRVPVGQTLGIVGASGSGKSTVARLLMRLVEPDSGSILLDGVDTGGLALKELRRSIAIVPQDTVLFDDTVIYNIGFGRAGADRKDIENAARAAQLHEFVMTLPEGYDTVVGERGVKLSGGERQRVAIARAILKSPTIFVFDEATSSLDSRTEMEILRSLRRISRSHTTIVIAHRLSTVVHADEIVVFDKGQIVERGTHELLLRGNGKYAALWVAQRDCGMVARTVTGA